MGSEYQDIESIRRRPNSVHRKELISLLEKFGFVLRGRGKGSHDMYKHPDFPQYRPLSIPRHNPVASYIVKQVISHIESILAERDSEERGD